MKINGPYIHRTGKLKGRKYIVLKYDNKKTTMLYSRWLMQKHLSRKLTYDETVDHINEDYTDDRIENFQILSRAENARKSNLIQNPKKTYSFICPICKKNTEKDLRRVKWNNKKQGKSGPFCSRSCAGLYNQRKRKY